MIISTESALCASFLRPSYGDLFLEFIIKANAKNLTSINFNSISQSLQHVPMQDVMNNLRHKHIDFVTYSATDPKLLIAIIIAAWTQDSESSDSELAFITLRVILSQRPSISQYFEDLSKDTSKVLDQLFTSVEGCLRRRMLKGFALWVRIAVNFIFIF